MHEFYKLMREMSDLIAELGREYLELPNPDFNYNAKHVSTLQKRLDQCLVDLRGSNDIIKIDRARRVMALWAKGVRREFKACRDNKKIGFEYERRGNKTVQRGNLERV
jgi:hypothetical protein